jgi:CBS domain-containing protein
MTLVRDVMTPGAECVEETQTLTDAAKKMRDLDVGALPICGQDNRLKGMVTDRDIVIKCLAEDGDPRTATAGSLAEGKLITIGADADLNEALELMATHQLRRLPVIDDHELVGIIAQADVATNASSDQTGETVKNISH